ncbi:hypothetical protein FQA47_019966 [Oryzias melastigma]|uniref:Uncharacterized protein n=1 Tax=Oryzias melastigma TaxID=30732 RepID=A0A834KYC5_ORYME|nr:hypothetical protein FQA47_019966 [Oryzias melastigma]
MITLVTASDMVTPVEPVPEGLVYGLTLSPPSLAPPSASLAPIALESASPCTIAFASPVAHAMLPTAPSLITVLAPPPVSNQPIQVMAPNISPEPMVICTENPLNSPCDLAAAFSTTNICKHRHSFTTPQSCSSPTRPCSSRLLPGVRGAPRSLRQFNRLLV